MRVWLSGLLPLTSVPNTGQCEALSESALSATDIQRNARLSKELDHNAIPTPAGSPNIPGMHPACPLLRTRPKPPLLCN
jgi:hypothetical protein